MVIRCNENRHRARTECIDWVTVILRLRFSSLRDTFAVYATDVLEDFQLLPGWLLSPAVTILHNWPIRRWDYVAYHWGGETNHAASLDCRHHAFCRWEDLPIIL